MVKLDFAKSNGLIPAIAQDYETGEVLMLAYINEEAWTETLRSGCATYWTRSRGRLWKKGESSGNIQEIREILVDCDGDAVIFKINQVGGAACHTGHRTCFFRKLEGGELIEVGEKVFDPEKVYQREH
ncbi:MAG: phosphoribosyl-AMP cyclohydrolase [Victivallaceae bacterium]|nr:phosphoribosyl-AMP cyclohydrolase [Victivallaceae bacterium]